MNCYACICDKCVSVLDSNKIHEINHSDNQENSTAELFDDSIDANCDNSFNSEISSETILSGINKCYSQFNHFRYRI